MLILCLSYLLLLYVSGYNSPTVSIYSARPGNRPWHSSFLDSNQVGDFPRGGPEQYVNPGQIFSFRTIEVTLFQSCTSCNLIILQYGNTGCEVFKRGIKNQKGIWLKINFTHCHALAHMPKQVFRPRVLHLHESHFNKKPYFYHYYLPYTVPI